MFQPKLFSPITNQQDLDIELDVKKYNELQNYLSVLSSPNDFQIMCSPFPMSNSDRDREFMLCRADFDITP